MVNLFRLAAAQGKASAQYSLGLMYSLGHGVPQDYVRSHMWLTTSKAKTNPLLLSVVPKMTPTQVELALKMAKRCEESNYKQCDEPEGADDSKSIHQFTPLKKLVE